MCIRDRFYPTRLKAIWHGSEGDLVYFDARDIEFEYVKRIAGSIVTDWI